MGQHPIVHVEIPVKDPDTDGQFYNTLFGWEIHPMPEMGYTTFTTGNGGPGGGLPKIDGDMVKPNEPLVHVGTHSINETLAKAETLGASVVVPKTEIPGMGWFAVFVDPSGNRIGVYEDGGFES
jgi:predicted enzyme related to lactoylglutathione lyase